MTRLGISVEGTTERDFITQVIAPHLADFGVYAVATPLDGNISLDRIRHHLPKLRHCFDAITTMYDYYGFKSLEGRTPIELETAIHECVGGDQSVIPYIQVHDFEALLFSSPDITARALRDQKKSLDLVGIVQRHGPPENINSSPETCPKARLTWKACRPPRAAQHFSARGDETVLSHPLDAPGRAFNALKASHAT